MTKMTYDECLAAGMTQAETAKARGVGVNAVSVWAVRHGKTFAPGHPLKPVSIRGVTYPSRTAAAKAFGVTPGAITNAEQRGTLDRVGITYTWEDLERAFFHGFMASSEGWNGEIVGDEGLADQDFQRHRTAFLRSLERKSEGAA